MKSQSTITVAVLCFAVLFVACGEAEADGTSSRSTDSSPMSTTHVVAQATETTPVEAVTSTVMVTEISEEAESTPGIADDAACAGVISGSGILFETLDEMAWFSHQVVVGRVAEVLPSERVIVDGSTLPFTIVTDAVIQVDQRLRGKNAETLLVRTWGGTIGDCSQVFEGTPTLEPGDQVVLFLRLLDPEADDGIFYILGDYQGVWTVAEDGVATTLAAHLMPDGTPIQLNLLIESINSNLDDGPPDSPWNDEYLIPADVAPIEPESSAD